MKIIRYTLLENGEVPKFIIDGGYFVKPNGGNSPQDYDLIGTSLDSTGLEEYKTKQDFENHVKSFRLNYADILTGKNIVIQDIIDKFWNRVTTIFNIDINHFDSHIESKLGGK